jgi:putative transposase
MNEDQAMAFRIFEPKAEVVVVERRLPHWSQAGTICFITWRTHDSMPRPVLEAWYRDRACWLRARGIDPNSPDWQESLHGHGYKTVSEFLQTFWNRWHDALDACHGSGVLRQTDLAQIVATSLLHFDKERYLMLDFVVMPNHVHILASFPDEQMMLAQCESWKHYTATQLNRCLNRKGRFWQQDGFDHLVRSEEQFLYLRRYIAANPARAGLPPADCLHYTKPL